MFFAFSQVLSLGIVVLTKDWSHGVSVSNIFLFFSIYARYRNIFHKYNQQMDMRKNSHDDEEPQEAGSFLGLEGVTPQHTGGRGNRRGNRERPPVQEDEGDKNSDSEKRQEKSEKDESQNWSNNDEEGQKNQGQESPDDEKEQKQSKNEGKQSEKQELEEGPARSRNNRRNQRGRQDEEEEEKVQEEKEVKKVDESNWDDDEEKKSEKKEKSPEKVEEDDWNNLSGIQKNPRREKGEIQNLGEITIQQKSIGGESWDHTQNNNDAEGVRGNRGNRGNRNDEAQEGVRGNRGNRGNRDQRTYEQEDGGFTRGEDGRRGNFGQGRREYGGDRGRGRGSGRGGGRGGGFYGGNRDGNRDGGNFRGNRDGEYRGNRDGGRGGRGGRQDGGFRGNRDGDFRGNRDGDFRRDRNDGERGDYRNNQKEEVKVAKEVKFLPTGLRSWPEITIYVRQTKLTFSYRSIKQHKCSMMVMPFRDLTFNVYPGKLINNFEYDYRTKLEAYINDGKMNSPGNFKAWKCVGLEKNFGALGFINIGKEAENLNTWLSALFEGVSSKMTDKNIPSILLPYSKELGDLSVIWDFLVKFITVKKTKLEEVYISTNNQEDFLEGFDKVTKEVRKYVVQNTVSIDY